MITWKLYLQKPFFLLTRVAAKVNLFSLSFSFRFLEKSSKANFMLLLSTLIHISMSSVFWIKHRYETSLLQDQKWEEENRPTMSNNFHSIDISPTSVRVGGGGGGGESWWSNKVNKNEQYVQVQGVPKWLISLDTSPCSLIDTQRHKCTINMQFLAA